MNAIDWKTDSSFGAASNAFAESLRRLIQVSTSEPNGDLKTLSQKKLAEISGVSRQGLAIYLSNDPKKPANPTLETICLLADCLGVPPAFFLLTADDWTRISQAINYYSVAAVRDVKFQNFARELINPESKQNHKQIAKNGLDVAIMLGLISRKSTTELTMSKQNKAVASTCSMPPLAQIDPSIRPIILTLCAIIGASTPDNERDK